MNSNNQVADAIAQHQKIETNARMIAVIVAAVIFLAMFEATVITTALPQIAVAFAVPPIDLSISITIYILVSAAFLPSSTWIAERFGPRRVFAVSMAAFAIASILCGLSQNVWQFVAARICQALPAAFMLPVGMLILLRSIEKKDLASAMAIATTPGLIAPIVGPAVGGILVTFFHWSWIFYLNIPIVLLTLVLIFRFIPDLPEDRSKPFDVNGFLLSAIGLSAFLYGLEQLGAAHANRALALGLITLGTVLCVLFVRYSLRTLHPCIPLSALRIETFRVSALTAGSAVKIPFRALGFVLPLMVQAALGMTAFQAGMLVLAYNGGDLLLKPFTRPMLRRLGFRWAMFITAILTPLMTTTWLLFDLQTPFWIIFLVLVLSGAARSLLMTGLVAMTFADVPKEEYGGASVLNNVLIQIIGAVAVCLSVLVLNLHVIFGGSGTGRPDLRDFRLTIITLVLVGFMAVPIFWRLRPDAGQAVSGHV
jgi:EmrB/QacA subfamily drug resistance transporter